MTQTGRDLGVAMDFGVEVGNTLDSHRLLWWAGAKGEDPADPTAPGTQEALARILARGHFTQRRSAQDHAVLVAACAEVGLDGAEAQQVLDAPERYQDEVLAAIDALHRRGIFSIPVFVFCLGDGRVLAEVSGAQSEAAYATVLRKAASAR
eukprot:m.8628 g.8628  ORF g.8628 m.8628 type:complete len:151 (-) comp4081_c0_seq1:290-742(-)